MTSKSTEPVKDVNKTDALPTTAAGKSASPATADSVTKSSSPKKRRKVNHGEWMHHLWPLYSRLTPSISLHLLPTVGEYTLETPESFAQPAPAAHVVAPPIQEHNMLTSSIVDKYSI